MIHGPSNVKENVFTVFVKNLKKRDHMEEIDVHEDTILKMILNKSYRVAWIWFVWFRIRATIVNTVTNHRFP